IRDKLVTGVQTCALPISQRARPAVCEVSPAAGAGLRGPRACGDGGARGSPVPGLARKRRGRAADGHVDRDRITLAEDHPRGRLRSEERRVGKESSTWWTP